MSGKAKDMRKKKVVGTCAPKTRAPSLADAASARKASESPCRDGWNYHVFSLASPNCTMCGASR